MFENPLGDLSDAKQVKHINIRYVRTFLELSEKCKDALIDNHKRVWVCVDFARTNNINEIIK